MHHGWRKRLFKGIIAHTFHGETKVHGMKTGIYSGLNNELGSDCSGD